MQSIKGDKSYIKGYAALASVIVIAALVIVIGITVSLTSINEVQTSLSSKKSDESLDFVEGCVEEALLRLRNDSAIPTQIPLPEGTCNVTIESQSGTNWLITVDGELDNHAKSLEIDITRDTSVVVNSWLEK